MERVKIGIIGCGRISDLHARGYMESEKAEIYAVCDTDEELAQRRQEQWGAAKYYTDYRSLLADPEIAAVDVLTPHVLHEEIVVASLNAGKHTAVQKPVSIDLASTDRMIEAARQSGKVFKVTENYLFYPPIVKARQIIRSGAIGSPQNIRINLIGAGAGGWEIPKEAWAWRMKEFSESRGMETFDHGHHLWSTVWYLMGGIDEVSAWIGNTGGMVDAPAIVMWRHERGGSYGSCTFSYCNEMTIPSDYYANDEWIDITGSKGILRINRCTGKLVSGPVLSVFNNDGWTHHNDIDDDWQCGFTGAVGNFVEAVLGNEGPALSGEDAREILKINLAVQKSARTQKSVFTAELEDSLPAVSNISRRRSNRKEFRSFMKSLAGGDGKKGGASALAAKAVSLTQGLPERADNEKIGPWTGKIGLELKDEQENKQFSLVFEGGRLAVSADVLPEEPDLVITTSSAVWGGILSGKRNIQTAFVTGKLKFNGDLDQGFKLKEVTGF